MKKSLIPLFLILLLCGCGPGNRGITSHSNLTPPSENTAPSVRDLYDPRSEQERRTAGAFKTFVLPLEDTYGILSLGEGILVFSGQEHTTLTLLKGDPLVVENQLVLDFFLPRTSPSVQVRESTFSYYDPSSVETIVTTPDLTVISRYPKPEASVGVPLFAEQDAALFYISADGIHKWELESGRHRLLRGTEASPELTGIHCGGSILQCRTPDGAVQFLSSDTGQLLHSHPGDILFSTEGQYFYGNFLCGSGQSIVFGIPGEPVRALYPRDPEARCFFLPQNHGAVTVSSPAEKELTLDYYDLDTGLRTACAALAETQEPISVAAAPDGDVYLLARDPQYGQPVLYRWYIRQTATRDSMVYTGLHYTARNPDRDGLARCQAYADTLAERYGISIRLWKDAVKVQPWDYDLEPEYRTDVLMDLLQTLDTCLSHYPPEILSQTAGHFTSLNLCLVRSITGTPESGLQDPATGVQFQEGTDAYVAIAAGPFADRAIYHELFHLMEVHIFGNSIALDQWNSLNPAGFNYDYSYISNKTRDSGVYLRHDTRSFVDTYSMSYPKEDRARILEYAMMPGNQDLFQAQTLRRKLQTLCKGIREAYGLKKSPETFLWEQYLE